jgi:hypothetical protein
MNQLILAQRPKQFTLVPDICHKSVMEQAKALGKAIKTIQRAFVTLQRQEKIEAMILRSRHWTWRTKAYALADQPTEWLTR